MQMTIFVCNAQRLMEMKRLGGNAYELTYTIVFDNDVCSDLMRFCWDIDNIKNIMKDEDVIISCTYKNVNQIIEYDYTFMMMRYYSSYERVLMMDENKLKFTLITNECSIPFIPNIIDGYGAYTFTFSANKTTMIYYQYSKCDGAIHNFYYNYIKSDVEEYFELFEREFLIYNNKTIVK